MFKNFTVIQHATPNGVASSDFGGFVYKFMGNYPDKTDAEIKEFLLGVSARDEVYTIKYTLTDAIAQAKKFNMKLVIGMNEVMEDFALVSPDLFGKVAGILADILIENGFNNYTSAINLINEPSERWKIIWDIYINYVKSAAEHVKDRIPLIIYNEETHFFGTSKFGIHNILKGVKNLKNIVIGVHHLSSLGKTPNWQNIIDAKTIADQYGRDIVCNEGGSWFSPYRSSEGHAINLKLMKMCYDYKYKAFFLCLPYANEYALKRWPNLLYVAWNNEYKKIITPPENIKKYWNDFESKMKIYKKEGEQPMPPEERLIYYKVPYMEGEDIKAIETKLRILGFDLPTDGKFDLNDDRSTRVFQELTHIIVDGKIGLQTKGILQKITVENFYPEVFQDIFIKKDYPIATIDYFLSKKAHPNLYGSGIWFKQAEDETGIPVEWLLANAMQESGSRNEAGVFLIGQSYYGREWKNIFGWAIYDSGPQPAGKFATYKDCILTVPKEIKRLYLTPGSPHNNGQNIFGIEVKYSTAGHNAIRKAQYYRQICAFMDAGIKTPVPEYVEDLAIILEKYFVKK